MLISTSTGLAEFCARLSGEPWITIDTEFMRDRTYWPKLCLVQVAGAREAVAIDPLAADLDLRPLLDLMADPGILKIFHACRQDLEIFWRLMDGAVPAPVFDSQVAAMVCGFGEEVAYETLVTKIARAQLDKSSRFTDWSRRPLTDAQLHYALSDVTHLRVIYDHLTQRIEKAGRSSWVAAEMKALTDPALFEQHPEESWRRLKIRTRDPRFVAIIQRLAAWREHVAQARDIPRQRVVRDDILLEIAAHKPRSQEDLRGHERVNLDRRSADAVVEIIAEVMALDPSKLPKLEQTQEQPRGLGPLIELLRVLLKLVCEEAQVAQRLVASSGDLEALAIDDRADIPALHGWRREVFGEKALALKQGRLALTVRGRSPIVIDVGDRPA